MSNAPIRRETHTSDIPLGQKADIYLGEEVVGKEDFLTAIDGPLFKDYADELAFAEEPVTIRIAKAQGKDAANVVDCWVNGKSIEFLVNGKWATLGQGAAPCNMVFTTKRKYVEVLARSKIDAIRTQSGAVGDENPENKVLRETYQRNMFSVIRDASPRGGEWLTRLLQEVG